MRRAEGCRGEAPTAKTVFCPTSETPKGKNRPPATPPTLIHWLEVSRGVVVRAEVLAVGDQT
ncbi:MAG: hypothetical protein H6673_15515 [Anaerolineales bacterium]|nr:hypothetical protein [Anaerolineales bacterium]